MPNSPAAGVQSLERFLLIIETMSRYPRGAALAELCAETDLPKSTVSRMVSCLVTRGYAEQDLYSKHYHLTPRFFEIGCSAAGSPNILSVALPYMRDISEKTGEVVHLVVRSGNDVLYLHKEEPMNSIASYMSSFIGRRNPMYCTGVGKCILAYLPREEALDILRHTSMTAFTEHTITSLPAMEEELNHVRRQGYAFDDEEHEKGIRCLAVPVLDYNSNPLAAFSISTTVERLNAERASQLLPMLIKVSRDVSRHFGR